ncbi:hypothetical protein [Pseudooceanicola sp. LIPI14-2-Ac024]|uniref:hypothetical protein n=1 Tax=Pseudooceanicola sp. LIPI14-2-Ac024 TaxID=3344875 RepID=UPI0035CFE563
MAEPRILFLERRTYRRRRLADLARLMPVIGLVLLLVPLLWDEGPGGVPTSWAIYWIFGVWAVLVVVSAWLSSRRVDVELDGNGARRPMPGGAEDPGRR